MPRPLPVWGFPNHYNPNLMGEVCDRCGQEGSWLPRPIEGQNFTAWTCAKCILLQDRPQQRRLEIPE